MNVSLRVNYVNFQKLVVLKASSAENIDYVNKTTESQRGGESVPSEEQSTGSRPNGWNGDYGSTSRFDGWLIPSTQLTLHGFPYFLRKSVKSGRLLFWWTRYIRSSTKSRSWDQMFKKLLEMQPKHIEGLHLKHAILFLDIPFRNDCLVAVCSYVFYCCVIVCHCFLNFYFSIVNFVPFSLLY